VIVHSAYRFSFKIVIGCVLRDNFFEFVKVPHVNVISIVSLLDQERGEFSWIEAHVEDVVD